MAGCRVGTAHRILLYGAGMPNYQRAYVPGGTFFLTVATYERRPLFADAANVERLRRAVRKVKQELPFDFVAAVVLPDHFHFLWTLPEGDSEYPKRIGRIKVEFTHSLRGVDALPVHVSASRRRHRESDVWHRRYWEHTVRDEHDFEMHLDYIHYNPVKHGLCRCPHQWPYPSFRKWVARGVYAPDWACVCGGRTWKEPDWGRVAGHTGE
jgi:putative transposase